MLALRIIAHSSRQIVMNLPVMLRLIAAPMAITFLIYFLSFDSDQIKIILGGGVAENGFFDWSLFLVPLALAMLLWPWIAVSFHRFLLNGEPVGTTPGFRAGLIIRYLGMVILITLIITLPIGLVVGLIMAIIDSYGGTVAAVIIGIILVVFAIIAIVAATRMSAGLPGLTIGDGTAFQKAWRATSGQNVTIFLVFFIPAALFFLLTYLVEKLDLTIISYLLTDWVYALLNLSILTTLWGHLVEGRELH